MAKYRHRIFEMYESRDETIRALTPKSAQTTTADVSQESWTFEHLAVSCSASVTHVQFNTSENVGADTATNFGGDLARLADRLGRNSKVLLDFAGVKSFSADSINALVQFQQMLQTKGSRMALCCLAPATRESFFAR